jgi:hypothetical protein
MSRLLRLLGKNRESTVEIEGGAIEDSSPNKFVKIDEGDGNQRAMPKVKQTNLPSDSLPEGCHLKYPTDQVTRDELKEIEERVHNEGYILLWSTVLRDLVAFYRDDAARSRIPPGFVPYSDAELKELFGENRPPISKSSLRLIHEAKKSGGYITGFSNNAQER